MHLAGEGVDHPTTKPVQNAFYTNFFHLKIFGGGPPGPGHGHDATGFRF